VVEMIWFQQGRLSRIKS